MSTFTATVVPLCQKFCGRQRTSWSVIQRKPPACAGVVVTVIAATAAARSAIGSSNTIAIGCATPTVMPSVGNELAAVLLFGTTVVNVLVVWLVTPATLRAATPIV